MFFFLAFLLRFCFCSCRNCLFSFLIPNAEPPSFALLFFGRWHSQCHFTQHFFYLRGFFFFLFISPLRPKCRIYFQSLASLCLFLCPDSGLPSASRSDCWRGCSADTHNKARLGWKCSRVPAGGCESRVPAGERSDPAGSSAQPGLSRQREPTAPNHGQPWKLQLNLEHGSGPKHGASRKLCSVQEKRRTGFKVFLRSLPSLLLVPVPSSWVHSSV